MKSRTGNQVQNGYEKQDTHKINYWALIITVLAILGFSYAALIVLFSYTQEKYIFSPQKELVADPLVLGLEYNNVIYKTTDGEAISGWFVPAENSRGVILICHGNAGNISHRLDTIKIFNMLHLDVFIFDYRGYGESTGIISEEGLYWDALGAWEYLVEKRKYNPDQIIIFGRSLGGSVAAWLAKTRDSAGLILESSFTSIKDLGNLVYPYLPIRMMTRFSFDTLEYLKNVDCPVLVIHSKEDEMIPIDHGLALYKAANQNKNFLEILGTHNTGFYTSQKKYMQAVEEFLTLFSNLPVTR
ncbi:MAG: alpha/beta hydrolase [FCB group bacterium]|nr:alpha/beta hydrolase [FCB group bacterium]